MSAEADERYARPVIRLHHIVKRFVQALPDNAYGNADAHKSPGTSYFTALDDISFDVFESECVLIAGANGSGKSILMSIIAGLNNPTTGSVSTRGRCGLVFQDADTQILGETPVEDVMFGLKNLKVPDKEAKERTLAALEKTGLAERSFFPARFLSGGENGALRLREFLRWTVPSSFSTNRMQTWITPASCR